MDPAVELNLALVLFLPWYAILAGLYWFYPRQPRTLSRWGFDVAALAVAIAATVASMHWSFFTADTSFGAMWPQILATSVSYGVFLAAMTVAFFLRRRLITAPYLARQASNAPGRHS
ncbi:MAG TPA: hypothetical protein VGD42_06185 [Lysobacter sp.]